MLRFSRSVRRFKANFDALIQPKTIHLSRRLRETTTELVGFIPQSLVLRSIVLG